MKTRTHRLARSIPTRIARATPKSRRPSFSELIAECDAVMDMQLNLARDLGRVMNRLLTAARRAEDRA